MIFINNVSEVQWTNRMELHLFLEPDGATLITGCWTYGPLHAHAYDWSLACVTYLGFIQRNNAHPEEQMKPERDKAKIWVNIRCSVGLYPGYLSLKSHLRPFPLRNPHIDILTHLRFSDRTCSHNPRPFILPLPGLWAFLLSFLCSVLIFSQSRSVKTRLQSIPQTQRKTKKTWPWKKGGGNTESGGMGSDRGNF